MSMYSKLIGKIKNSSNSTKEIKEYTNMIHRNVFGNLTLYVE